MKVLLIKISSLGDIIHSFAVINQITAKRPDISIDMVVGESYQQLAGQANGIRKLFPFKRKSWGKGWWKPSVIKEMFDFIFSIREEGYDICLDLQGLLRSGLITAASGAKVKTGFSNAREGSRFMYNKIIDEADADHAVDKLLRSLRIFDIEIPQKPDFRFQIPDDKKDRSKKLLTELGIAGKYIIFHSGARWKTKLWIEEYWRDLAHWVHKKTGLPILFTGSADDQASINRIIAESSCPLHNIAGSGELLDLAAILENAAFAVTVDSGPMHIARALNIPLVAIFGPTSPNRTGPYKGERQRVIQPEQECAPCFKRKCRYANECMESILPSQVLEEVSALMK